MTLRERYIASGLIKPGNVVPGDPEYPPPPKSGANMLVDRMQRYFYRPLMETRLIEQLLGKYIRQGLIVPRGMQ
jgi:hypothetical protein